MFIPVPAPEEMSAWDAASIQLGIPEEVLMENAARAAMNVLYRHAGSVAGLDVLLLAGGGNNGGDAFCMARHLLDAGARPVLVCTRAPEAYTGAAALWLNTALRLGVPAISSDAWEAGDSRVPSQPDIIVDGLLGTGFHGLLRERERRLVERLNRLSPRLLLAIDVPSGLDALQGRPCPDAVRAHVTVTFQAAKPGLLLPEAEAFTGILEVAPIGIPTAVQHTAPPSFLTWIAPAQRRPDGSCTIRHGAPAPESAPPVCRHPGPAHKSEAGRVLIMGGSAAYTGAPCLAAQAALRAGAGLVGVAAPEPVLSALRVLQPAAIAYPLPGENGPALRWETRQAETLRNAMRGARAVVFGPGLGRDGETQELAAAILDPAASEKRPPTVIDADALYALSRRPKLFAALRPCDVLTPHPGEAAALLGISAGDVQADRFAALRRLSALAPAVWVLKGKGTLIAVPGGPSVISPWDVPQLAVAGSGDVLAGLIGALLARGLPAPRAAVLAVWGHAFAGMHLANAFPERGNTPQHIADALPCVLGSAGLADMESSKGEGTWL